MNANDTVLNEDWEVIRSLLPKGWEAKAKELGAMRRMRGFASPDRLLRTLLIHVGEGSSFRQTAVRAREGGLADVSDVALLKRLRNAGLWFSWLARSVMKEWLMPEEVHAPDSVTRVRVVDGTTIQRPGAKEATWRVHYSMGLPAMFCDEVHVTGKETGESLKLFSVQAGDLILGDRGLAHRSGIHHVVSQGGDVLIRISLTSVPCHHIDGGRFDLLGHLRRLQHHQIGDWPVVVAYESYKIFGRICAVRKTERATQNAREKARRESRKKGRHVRPVTLEAAGYAMVFTTLDRTIPAQTILNIYRARWQVELVFKLWKSHCALRRLAGFRRERILVELYGKLIGVVLTHFLITPLRMPSGALTNREISPVKVRKLLGTCARELNRCLGHPLQFQTALVDMLSRIGRFGFKQKRTKEPNTCHALALVSAAYRVSIADPALA